MTAPETQDLIGLALDSVSNKSKGFLDSNTISLQDNGTNFIHVVLKVN